MKVCRVLYFHQYILSFLFFAAVIRFFGNICISNGPQFVLEIYNDFLSILFTMLHDENETTRQVAMETVGVIGLPVEGKLLLHNEGYF